MAHACMEEATLDGGGQSVLETRGGAGRDVKYRGERRLGEPAEGSTSSERADSRGGLGGWRCHGPMAHSSPSRDEVLDGTSLPLVSSPNQECEILIIMTDFKWTCNKLKDNNRYCSNDT